MVFGCTLAVRMGLLMLDDLRRVGRQPLLFMYGTKLARLWRV